MGSADRLHSTVTIDVLPDDTLLEIFNFYVDQAYRPDAWHTLVHVCQRWRYIVFASPYRLNLQLLCTPQRPVKKMLDVWPALPIVINALGMGSRPQAMANIITALKQHNRVFKTSIWGMQNSLLKAFVTIKKPFPALTSLTLESNDTTAPVLPRSFLGGSAPRLRSLELRSIPFPTLGKLLLSTGHLVTLRLWNIPRSGYISPEAMAACVSALTRLKELRLEYRFPRSHAERESRHPPPLTRAILPALTEVWFKCDSEYLEDFLARIDAPRLDFTTITLFNQLVFDTPLLRDFIGRTEAFNSLLQAHIFFSQSRVEVSLFRRKGTADHRTLNLGISCEASDWQLSSLAQLCSSSLPPLPTLKRLEILHDRRDWQEDMENIQWLELIRPFTFVKNLALHERSAPLVAPALQKLAEERVPELLPALRNLSCVGLKPSRPIEKAIAQFIAAR